MSARVTFCRTIAGHDYPSPSDVPRRAGEEVACDEEVMCKCGRGPVICCRSEHGDSPHAAYGSRDRVLTVWDAAPSVDPVEVVARALAPTRIGPFGPNTLTLLTNGSTTQMTPGEVEGASRSIVAALRENGLLS